MKKLLFIALTLLSVKVSGILTKEEFEKRFREHQLEYGKKLEPFQEKIRSIISEPNFMHKIKKCCHQKKFTNVIADSNLIDEDIINPFGYQACIETAIFEELKKSRRL